MQHEALLKSFINGMQSCGKETLAQREAAAKETGLSFKSVNVRLSHSFYSLKGALHLHVRRTWHCITVLITLLALTIVKHYYQQALTIVKD